MNILVITHEHRFGVSTFIAKTELDRVDLPSTETLLEMFDIDFEENREEVIDIDVIGPDFIPTLTKDGLTP